MCLFLYQHISGLGLFFKTLMRPSLGAFIHQALRISSFWKVIPFFFFFFSFLSKERRSSFLRDTQYQGNQWRALHREAPVLIIGRKHSTAILQGEASVGVPNHPRCPLLHSFSSFLCMTVIKLKTRNEPFKHRDRVRDLEKMSLVSAG